MFSDYRIKLYINSKSKTELEQKTLQIPQVFGH